MISSTRQQIPQAHRLTLALWLLSKSKRRYKIAFNKLIESKTISKTRDCIYKEFLSSKRTLNGKKADISEMDFIMRRAEHLEFYSAPDIGMRIFAYYDKNTHVIDLHQVDADLSLHIEKNIYIPTILTKLMRL